METVTERPSKRNLERFMEATGKTEAEYNEWATQVGQRMHINKLDALVCAKLGLYTVAHLVYRSTQLPEGMPLHEADAYLIENSENPYELGKLWIAAKANAEHWTCKQSVLAEHLRAFKKEDFETHGDPNHLADVSRSWFKKDAVNLDVQLMEINDMGLLSEQITIQDAIDFVMAHKPGVFKNPAQLIVEQLESRFKEVTTFRIKDYYVQHIIKMCDLEPIDLEDSPF